MFVNVIRKTISKLTNRTWAYGDHVSKVFNKLNETEGLYKRACSPHPHSLTCMVSGEASFQWQ